jgi:hypothetical protein
MHPADHAEHSFVPGPGANKPAIAEHRDRGRREATTLQLAEIGGLAQQALRYVAAAQVLLWCSQRQQEATALELLVAAGTHVAAAAEQIDQALPYGDERVRKLSRSLRALAAADLADWTRTERYARLRAAYETAARLLPADCELREHDHMPHELLDINWW